MEGRFPLGGNGGGGQRFEPYGYNGAGVQRLQAPAPSHALGDEGDMLPLGALYSLAAQQDALDMDHERRQAAVTAMEQAQGPAGAGPSRMPFFRPYQAPALPSYSSTLPNMPRMQPVQPQLPLAATQQVQPFARPAPALRPLHPSQIAFLQRPQPSSPSPAVGSAKAGTLVNNDLSTPGLSDASEDVFAFQVPDDDGGLDASRPLQASMPERENIVGVGAGTARAPLREVQAQSAQSQDVSRQGLRARADRAAPRNRHGVRLKPVTLLPDAWRTIFKFPVFNAVQSTCFESVFESDRNLVVSAPTGSGKTVVFELAIIRMLQSRGPTAKAVYLAPTKALCSERAKDWTARLQPLGCEVVEITGDTSFSGLSAARHARVIITTPEKWDSLTRRWSDHDKILSSLALLLIDEVHILHEKERGARLEVIVSRMKNYGQEIRFVALSATVPNLEDVAEWIGRNRSAPINPKAAEQGVPDTFADLFRFGAEFRPCQLSKFVYGYPKLKDEFAFTASLNKYLLGLIKEHSKGKSCLIFVSTRKGTVQAADAVAKEVMAMEQAREMLPWSKPTAPLHVRDPKLAELTTLGIAFHHAGMELDDRRAVEQAFLSGSISVLCATTTLATGVNLPAYCVIIRGTKQYGGSGWAELSDLDFVQMIGRAGRPQFDDEGVAVVMTENERRQHYLDLASGNTVIESALAAELVEHINAELVLRGTSSKQAIERWLEGTFLHVRLLKNPAHYNLDASAAASKTSKQVMHSIVEDALRQLDQHELATASAQHPGDLTATDFGDILAKYFLSFKTMLLLLQIPADATVKDLLDLMTEAEEFKDIRMRQGEKNLFTALSKHEEIRFPPAKVNGVKEKISLLIQAVLAGLSLQEVLGSRAAGYSPSLDAFLVFRHAPRVVKAMFDVFLAKRYGPALHSAFTLLRNINGHSWEGQPTVLRQLEGVGEKTYKILAGAGMMSIADVAAADPRRIEMLLNRNMPYGDKLVNQAKALPQFHLEVEQLAHETKRDGVYITVKVSAGLVDTGVKVKTSRKETRIALNMCVLTMSSDLELYDFRKMPIKKLTTDKDFKVTCKLVKPSQRIVVTVACDEIAGSAVRSELRHGVPASNFPEPVLSAQTAADLAKEQAAQELQECIDLFDQDDAWMVDGGDDGVKRVAMQSTTAVTDTALKSMPAKAQDEAEPEPEKLPNGNYKCLHQCKGSCRHLCCREGMEHPPHRKKGMKKNTSIAEHKKSSGSAPTLIDRFAQLEKKADLKQSAPSTSATSSKVNEGGSTRAIASTSTSTSQATLTNNFQSQQEVDEDDDDELPLIKTRKRKYDIDWTAYPDHDANNGDSTSKEGNSNIRSLKQPRRSKVSFSRFIDDEAGEDNRPEHHARAEGALSKARVGRGRNRMAEDEEDEDQGSLVDFIVDDDVEPSLHFSEDDDLGVTKTSTAQDMLCKGDLADYGIDDLANLFSDNDEEEAPQNPQPVRHLATADQANAEQRSEDDPLFFSYDDSHAEVPDSTSPTRIPDEHGPRHHPARTFATDAQLDEDELVKIWDDPFSSPTLLNATAVGSNTEAPSNATTRPTDPTDVPEPVTSSTITAGTAPTQPDSSTASRPSFADRLLAKLRDQKMSAPGSAGVATTPASTPAAATNEGHVEQRKDRVEDVARPVPTVDNQTASMTELDAIWAEWDLLKS